MNGNNKKKKVVHVFMSGAFMDDSTYQETQLAREHKVMGNDVYIVTTNVMLNLDGNRTIVEPKEYLNSDGVKIIRLNTHRKINRSRGNYKTLYLTLVDIKPDFIMDHGFCIVSSIGISMYKEKYPNCRVIADSHATNDNMDYSYRAAIYLMILRMISNRYYNMCEKIYGITSETLDILDKVYNVPKSKIELLPLGYDQRLISDDCEYWEKKLGKKELRHKYVFVNGGKLDKRKKTLELVRAIRNKEDVFLIIFGTFVSKEYEELVKKNAGDNVQFVGALTSKKIYSLYSYADVAIFPGSPSCLRQEAVSSGLPIIMCCNDGDQDINIIENDNGIILNKNWSEIELKEAIQAMIDRIDYYRENAKILANGDYSRYSYSSQAKYLLGI